MNASEGPYYGPMCDKALRALVSTGLILAAGVCNNYGRDCEPSDCPAGQTCSANGGCELQDGSCATDADCVQGGICVLISSRGLFGEYTDRVCQQGRARLGQPCHLGTSPLDPCVGETVCSSEQTVGQSPAPDSGAGGNYWLDTGDTFEVTAHVGPSLCVPSNSLGVGASCSNSSACARGLICHSGYIPRQCRDLSGGGESCGVDDDCLSGVCGNEDTEQSCASADPSCDIRVDPSCGYWLSCAQCLRKN